MLHRLGVSAARVAAVPLRGNGMHLARMVSSSANGPDAIARLLANNRKWRSDKHVLDKDYFTKTAPGQQPQCLWIGCADSRVPAELLSGVDAGEMFVMRNIANLVVATDMSGLSVLQYAVEHLKVKDIIVCGHTNCGGVAAALANQELGLIDSWLQNIRDVCRLHDKELAQITDAKAHNRRVVELNTIEQCLNVLKINFVQRHQAKFGFPRVHGLLYDIPKGELTELPLDPQAYARKYEAIYQLRPAVHGEALDRGTLQAKAVRELQGKQGKLPTKDVRRALLANPILFSTSEIAHAFQHLQQGEAIDLEQLADFFETQ